jgi:hypothetical protein
MKTCKKLNLRKACTKLPVKETKTEKENFVGFSSEEEG